MTFPSNYRKGIIALMASFITVAAVAATASAVPLLEDHFPYPNGNLTGNNGWATHSGTATFVQVSDGVVVLTNGSGSREDNHRAFALQPNNVKTYASFFLTVPTGTVMSGFDYFAHFRPTGVDSNQFCARTYTGTTAVGGDYAIGISTTSSGTSPVVSWPTGLTFGQTYRIVTAYDPITGTSTLWVDPQTEASPSVSSTHVNQINRSLQDYAWRQGATGAALQQVDNLFVGTTFDDVIPPPPVPSASTWGLAALALLVAGAGTLFVVRRRNALA